MFCIVVIIIELCLLEQPSQHTYSSDWRRLLESQPAARGTPYEEPSGKSDPRVKPQQLTRFEGHPIAAGGKLHTSPSMQSDDSWIGVLHPDPKEGLGIKDKRSHGS